MIAKGAIRLDDLLGRDPLILELGQGLKRIFQGGDINRLGAGTWGGWPVATAP